MVYYTTSLRGIGQLYQAANSFTGGIMLYNIPFIGFFQANVNGILKAIVDICGLLVWSNMTEVENTLAPVTWGFPGYTVGGSA